MKKIVITLIINIFFIIAVKCQTKYRSFLEKNQYEPKEYIESLFDNNDLVIICEREHPEMTQYDFFFELVSQKWFIETVGVILMEIPTRSIQDKLDTFLFSENLSKTEITKKLKHICQNLTTSPLWTKSNFLPFLRKIYNLNQTLIEKEKIRIIGTEVEFSWERIRTKEEYNCFLKTLINRDKSMADLILNWHKTSIKSNLRSKGLVIMNFRHAYINKYWSSCKKSSADNTARYIKEALPNKSTNVFLNRYTYSKFLDLPKKHNKGKWDKAFKDNGNQPIGFCLSNSPFGDDNFDDFPYIKTDLIWEDVFEHMIFYNPISEFINSFGVDKLVNNSFIPELERRYKLCGRKLTKRKVKRINAIKTSKIKI